ncbi:MAG: M36 family metallopeptidase [Chitinophagaceae bacterium]
MSMSITTGRKALICFVTVMLFITASAQNRKISTRQQALTVLNKNLPFTGLNQSTLNDYVVTDAYTDSKTGDLIVYLQQTYQGVPVYNKIGVYIFRHDTLVEKRADYLPKPGVKAGPNASATPAIQAEQAIQRAGQHLSIAVPLQWTSVETDAASRHYAFDARGFARHNLSSDLVWLPMEQDQLLKLSWKVRIGTADGNEEWLACIDAATGELLQKNNLIVSEKIQSPSEAPVTPPVYKAPIGQTQQYGIWQPKELSALPPAVNSAGYRVYPFPLEAANAGNRVLVNNPWTLAGTGNNATTLGWHYDNTNDYTYTRGNNVWARQDLTGRRDTYGFADTSLTAIPSLTFDQALDTSTNPIGYSNIRAGIDNLFYWNNLMHDISYQYGFDEAAGNFQADNIGRGGIGNDYVHAFSQDGGGTNNADFYTGPDGENPRMRMFLWNSVVTPLCHISSPAAADYFVAEGVLSSRNRLVDVGPVTAEVVLVNDVSGGTHRACGTISNASSLVGKIALIDRGGTNCPFTLKVKNAQNAGAVAVIVVNNVAGNPLVMSGDDTTITIPAVMLSLADGNTIKAGLPGVIATLSATGHNIDGALDNGVIAHEYTHGISNRLTAGPANASCLLNLEQMGEGWSDYMALMVTTNWATAASTDGTKKRPIGTYVLGQQTTGNGIRRFPYSTDMSINPLTYDSLATATAGEVHSIGEIWCATLWDMTWNIIAAEGIDPDLYHGAKGNNIALQLVMQGLKYQPCGPGFLDGRDAILKADSLLYNYAHKCAIWNAFARRGMGRSASQGRADSYTDQVPAKDLPAGLSIAQTVNKTEVASGDNIAYTIKATCDCSAQNNISVIDTLSTNLTYLSSTGGTYASPYVRFDGLNFAPGETKTFTVQAKVNASYVHPDTLINDTRDPATYSWTSSFSGSYAWTEVTTRSHSSSHSWYAYNATITGQQFLTSGDLVLDTLSTLSFWHYYETEASFDGGVVEISTNGGSTWQDLGPYMTRNPYNSNITPFGSETVSRKAFSGSSGGQFVQTVIALTGFAGTTARIRFRFGTDYTGGGDGWYIDDILLKNQKGVTSVANAFTGTTLMSRVRTVSTISSGTLPVNFLGFEAKAQGNTALLQWKVAAEVNVSEYLVQRSEDGITFTTIGTVAASTANTLEKDYAFTDRQPFNGLDYYRITEQDLDGRFTYSPIRSVNFRNNSLAVKLSPVPTLNHQVRLDITTADNTALTATLVNTVGQYLKTFTVWPGVNWLSLGNYRKGVYFLKVQTSNGQSEIRKVVIE